MTYKVKTVALVDKDNPAVTAVLVGLGCLVYLVLSTAALEGATEVTVAKEGTAAEVELEAAEEAVELSFF